jgi:hypothetical protein
LRHAWGATTGATRREGVCAKGGEKKVADKKFIDVVQYNAFTGKVTDVRMFEKYPNGDLVEVTPGAPERAWERAYFGLGVKEVDPAKLRRKHYDPNLKKLTGGSSINPSRSSRIPRTRNGLRVIKGGLR